MQKLLQTEDRHYVARSRILVRSVLAAAALGLLGFAFPASGQASDPNASTQTMSPKCPTCPIVVPSRPLDQKDLEDMNYRNAMKHNFDAANAERKRQIDDETTKLLILARDLKAKTQNLGSGPLPPLLLREAAVIEFLAKDVKDKMKFAVNGD